MPRKPSPLQSESSRKNGAKGRGPKSPETKLRSCQSARKWGLFARTVALPHELPQWAEQQYLAHLLSTKSPASMHLTNECVRATLIADRCESYRQATIEEQGQNERRKWRLAEKRKADRLAKELRGRPEATVPKLQSFGAGMH